MFENPIKRGRKEGNRNRCYYSVAGGTSTDAEGNIVWDGSGGGSSSDFNVNSFVDSLTSAIPGILTGSAAIIGANNNQPVYLNGQPGYQQNQPQQQPKNNNTALYIIIAVVVLLLVLGGAYYLTRK